MATDEERRAGRLRRLCRAWDACADCSLQFRETKVHHRGSLSARIFLVGEAPDEEEDQQGVPFVGPAGRRLDQLLREVGLHPLQDVFVANVLACHPPSNRQPTPSEARACSPRLFGMLQLVAPKVVVLLGGTAARLVGVSSVQQGRGRVHEMVRQVGEATFSAPAVVTFHPAYLLRSGRGDREVRDDLQLAIATARS